ncbi:hypothetical protein KKD52_03380 [Myxococcota bacterium]|nr:hypothetical protein [Myxococcota bacterium]
MTLSFTHSVCAACVPTGGDCGPDTCWPGVGGEYSCLPSEGRSEGEACDPDMNNWTQLPCGDGLICLDAAGLGDGVCLAFCLAQENCGGTDVCTIPVFEGLDDLGVCLPCTDIDEDGACAEVDCDDNDDTSFSGATELCEDGRDNDCDGAADALDDDCEPIGPDPDAGPDADADDDADEDTGADADLDTGADPGTRKDAACACRAAGGSAPDSLPASWPLFAFALLVPAISRRARHHSKNGEAPRKEESC